MTYIPTAKVLSKTEGEEINGRILTAGAGIQTADNGAGDGAVVALYTAHDYTYADEAARLAATGFVAGDVGKVAFQQSDGTYWTLTDDDPATWAAKTVEAGTGGAAAFTDLTDVPAAYTSQGGKLVKVKSTEDGLEFVTAGEGTGDVVQDGTVTAGHIAVFASDHHIEDGGEPSTGGGSPAQKIYLIQNFQ